MRTNINKNINYYVTPSGIFNRRIVLWCFRSDPQTEVPVVNGQIEIIPYEILSNSWITIFDNFLYIDNITYIL